MLVFGEKTFVGFLMVDGELLVSRMMIQKIGEADLGSSGSSFAEDRKKPNKDELPMYSSKQHEILKSIKDDTWLVQKIAKRIILTCFSRFSNPWQFLLSLLGLKILDPKIPRNSGVRAYVLIFYSLQFWRNQQYQLQGSSKSAKFRLLRYWKVCNWYLSALSSPESIS